MKTKYFIFLLFISQIQAWFGHKPGKRRWKYAEEAQNMNRNRKVGSRKKISPGFVHHQNKFHGSTSAKIFYMSPLMTDW